MCWSIRKKWVRAIARCKIVYETSIVRQQNQAYYAFKWFQLSKMWRSQFTPNTSKAENRNLVNSMNLWLQKKNSNVFESHITFRSKSSFVHIVIHSHYPTNQTDILEFRFKIISAAFEASTQTETKAKISPKNVCCYSAFPQLNWALQ